MPALFVPGRLETASHFIMPSRSHKDMWIFSSKTDNTYFAINASEDWILNSHKFIEHGEPIKRKTLFERLKELKRRTKENEDDS